MKLLPISFAISMLIAAPANADLNLLEETNNGSLTGQGQLENSDDRVSDGRYFDFWPFYAEAGKTISIVVESSEFDSVVVLTTDDGETINIIAENDDANSNTTNAQLDINVTREGEFVFAVLGYDSSMLGAYTVGVYETPTPQNTETSSERSARILEQAERLNRVMGGGSEMNTNSPHWDPF
ncbi:MAG: hypothetical protein AAF716_00600 [Cyanobacteria bacterium P01_D01_bin.1]